MGDFWMWFIRPVAETLGTLIGFALLFGAMALVFIAYCWVRIVINRLTPGNAPISRVSGGSHDGS
jgi:hypothetical protein